MQDIKSTYKTQVFLYINEQSKKEIKIIPFTIMLKRIKYFGHLTKETKDLYMEDYKILPKEIYKDINGRRPMDWETSIVNMTLPPIASHSASLSKSQWQFLQK